MEHQSTGAVNGRLQAIHNRLDEGEKESHMTVSSAWEGKDMASQRLMRISKRLFWRTIRRTRQYGMPTKTLKSCCHQNWQQP